MFVKVRDESNSSYNYHIVEQNAPKTKSGNRIVPLNSAALKALKSLYAINGKHKYVFSTSNGNRVYPRNVDRMFRSVLKKCCIKPTGVHTLRHTFASRLFANLHILKEFPVLQEKQACFQLQAFSAVLLLQHLHDTLI